MRRIKVAYIRFVRQGSVRQSILNQAKKEGNIIYGAQSIKKQIGIFSRRTEDYDIFSKKPKRSARTTEKNLDSLYGYDAFYTKPAMHPGTWKVMDKGLDEKKNTEDDFGVVDYTNMPKPKPKSRNYGGVSYRDLSLEKKAKLKSIRDPEFSFRHKKDKEDLARINMASGK